MGGGHKLNLKRSPSWLLSLATRSLRAGKGSCLMYSLGMKGGVSEGYYCHIRAWRGRLDSALSQLQLLSSFEVQNSMCCCCFGSRVILECVCLVLVFWASWHVTLVFVRDATERGYSNFTKHCNLVSAKWSSWNKLEAQL